MIPALASFVTRRRAESGRSERLSTSQATTNGRSSAICAGATNRSSTSCLLGSFRSMASLVNIPSSPSEPRQAILSWPRTVAVWELQISKLKELQSAQGRANHRERGTPSGRDTVVQRPAVGTALHRQQVDRRAAASDGINSVAQVEAYERTTPSVPLVFVASCVATNGSAASSRKKSRNMGAGVKFRRVTSRIMCAARFCTRQDSLNGCATGNLKNFRKNFRSPSGCK